MNISSERGFTEISPMRSSVRFPATRASWKIARVATYLFPIFA